MRMADSLQLMPAPREVEEALLCIAWPADGRQVDPDPVGIARAWQQHEEWDAYRKRWDEQDRLWRAWARAGIDPYDLPAIWRHHLSDPRLRPDEFRRLTERQLIAVYGLSPKMVATLKSRLV